MTARITGYGVGSPKVALAPPPVENNGVPVNPRPFNFGQLILDTATGDWYIYSGDGVFSPIGGTSGALYTLSDGVNTVVTPVSGNIQIADTTHQITSTAGTAKITLSIPTTFIAPGSIASTTSLTAGDHLVVTTGGATITAGGLTVTAGGAAITGTTNINITGSAVTTIGTGGTGAVKIGNATGNSTVTGDLSTTGDDILSGTGSGFQITDVSSGTSSIGQATLTSGTVTVSTSRVTASSLIFVTYDTCTSANACALEAPQSSIVAGTSFVITSQDLTDSSSLVNYWIIN